MNFKNFFSDSSLAGYVRAIRESPREIILNRRLLTTVALYAAGGLPLAWDQGSSSVIPSLPSFQKTFGLTSASNPKEISNFVSFVYIGAGVGSGLSFFINDRLGRKWSFRLYLCIWIVGQIIATFSNGHLGTLYAARIVSGLGIGPLTVISPVSIVEVAPTEFRGLLATWFSIVMLLSLTVSCFTVLGVYEHVATSKLQYQIVFFAPTIFIGLILIATIAQYESPRWLFLAGREEEAVKTLIELRGLPIDHPRLATELEDIKRQIEEEKKYGTGFMSVLKETFLVPANLRRFQQAIISYALAQLCGANSVTSYLIPILSMVGISSSDNSRKLFLSGMYSLTKFFCTFIASFLFIDMLGRRKSLFTGATIQMISDIYIGVFIKYKQAGAVSHGASQAAVAAIFIHGFGYSVGLLVLPYVFGAELWPNQIRSFGAAFAQFFHWLFFFGINKATPSLLAQTNNWGAFIFFAGWCFVALVYVYFTVPETAGKGLENQDALFEQPLWKAYKTSRQMKRRHEVIDSLEVGVGTDDTTLSPESIYKGKSSNMTIKNTDCKV